MADQQRASLLEHVPDETIQWLLGEDIPQVAVLTRQLLGMPDDDVARAQWARRNEYPPVSAILEAQREDGSWDVPSRDYQKYRGSLWQIHLLGELYADGEDPRVQRGAEYAFGRQLDDGSWSCSNARSVGSIPCLTANVGRALARLGYASDERVAQALGFCVRLREELGVIDCRQACAYQLNGYCHMITPKLLLFMAEVPRDLWPMGTEQLGAECVEKLRDKRVYRSLPAEYQEFGETLWSTPTAEREGIRDAFLAEHPELHYGPKPGWLRFGYPLSYNSDVLEALRALAAFGEPRRAEYEDALGVVERAADEQMRWRLRTTLNGKMYRDVEAKGQPSKWLTVQALGVLEHFG